MSICEFVKVIRSECCVNLSNHTVIDAVVPATPTAAFAAGTADDTAVAVVAPADVTKVVGVIVVVAVVVGEEDED